MFVDLSFLSEKKSTKDHTPWQLGHLVLIKIIIQTFNKKLQLSSFGEETKTLP